MAPCKLVGNMFTQSCLLDLEAYALGTYGEALLSVSKTFQGKDRRSDGPCLYEVYHHCTGEGHCHDENAEKQNDHHLMQGMPENFAATFHRCVFSCTLNGAYIGKTGSACPPFVR